MENINKISVVLPIKSSSAFEFEDFFEKSIKSVQFQNEHVDELFMLVYVVFIEKYGAYVVVSI